MELIDMKKKMCCRCGNDDFLRCNEKLYYSKECYKHISVLCYACLNVLRNTYNEIQSYEVSDTIFGCRNYIFIIPLDSKQNYENILIYPSNITYYKSNNDIFYYNRDAIKVYHKNSKVFVNCSDDKCKYYKLIDINNKIEDIKELSIIDDQVCSNNLYEIENKNIINCDSCKSNEKLSIVISRCQDNEFSDFDFRYIMEMKIKKYCFHRFHANEKIDPLQYYKCTCCRKLCFIEKKYIDYVKNHETKLECKKCIENAEISKKLNKLKNAGIHSNLCDN